jgi:hypothetical protein
MINHFQRFTHQASHPPLKLHSMQLIYEGSRVIDRAQLHGWSCIRKRHMRGVLAMVKIQDPAQLKGRRLRLAMFIWGTALMAIGQTACTVVDDDIAVVAKKNIVVVEAPRVSKAYAYPENHAERPAGVTARAVAYHGSAPYICSPSGFGQKSRCFARPPI